MVIAACIATMLDDKLPYLIAMPLGWSISAIAATLAVMNLARLRVVTSR